MGTKAHGRILVWQGASLWILQAPPGERYPKTAVHSHHVLQLTLALTGQVSFESGHERVAGRAIAVAPDAPHAFEGTGLVAHLFVASDGLVGRKLVRGLCAERPVASIAPALLGDFPARLRATYEDPRHAEQELRTLAQELITTLANEHAREAAPDPRITRLIAWITARLDQTVNLRDLSASIGLSPGRTRHLFVEQTGLSFRTYVLWLRVQRAVEQFANGASLTEAAHRAGFSDSAHLSRTFRRMFGITAASLSVS